MNYLQEEKDLLAKIKKDRTRTRMALCVATPFILMLVCLLLLSGCGGSSSELPVIIEPPVVIEPPIVDTLVIHRNSDYKSRDGVSVDDKAIITSIVFSQKEEDRLEGCNHTCFNPSRTVILGDDKDCQDCYLLANFLSFHERTNGTKVFMVIEDEHTLSRAERLIGEGGYSNVVLVSSSEEWLLKSLYNYPSAIIGESTDSFFDWHITSNSNCSAKCINPNGVGVGMFDGVIVN